MTVSIEQAQANLGELVRRLRPGEEVVITESERPVAKLSAVMPAQQRSPRQPGTLRGTVLYMAPDFDAPLDDFKEYME
jgi:prevent-host-death family protein